MGIIKDNKSKNVFLKKDDKEGKRKVKVIVAQDPAKFEVLVADFLDINKSKIEAVFFTQSSFSYIESAPRFSGAGGIVAPPVNTLKVVINFVATVVYK